MDQRVKDMLQPGDIAVVVPNKTYAMWNGAGWDPERSLGEISPAEYLQVEDTTFCRPIVTPPGPFIRSKQIPAQEVEVGQFYRACADDDPEFAYTPVERIEKVAREGNISRITTVDPEDNYTSYSMPFCQVIRVYLDDPTPSPRPYKLLTHEKPEPIVARRPKEQPHDTRFIGEMFTLIAAMNPLNSPRQIYLIASRCVVCGLEAQLEITPATGPIGLLKAIDDLRGPCPGCQADDNDFLAEHEPEVGPVTGELEQLDEAPHRPGLRALFSDYDQGHPVLDDDGTPLL